ncbi:prepilin-type N-terminal cleavage/methylation domain-containing protein [Rhodocyclus tenuis]|uniref:Prepilin-type N-terminal cleavage/methylation domain-containing protein n=1 Tax=Rhodocyclus tenuis TaxID=1066 RepID=A0A840G3E7_RHOTE|nr:prepilin-type N-terminal cleavage/methylation domain-containing protein [Rhodocyclus tenuis]MBB4246923.1 prepilin-type N-terminal cleavage/methylation domain-containing protein [Rhodocyclus tenuis]
MQRQQSGFTLVEIAIVLVIIGLLLGGVLKGQELINSAKVKNFATDFRNIPLFIYGYQDKFKAIPGDDKSVTTHLSAATLATSPATTTVGNGVINGNWDSTTVTDESYLFWQHVRLAGLAAGPTATADASYLPKNAEGGIIGIESGLSGYIGATAGSSGPPAVPATAALTGSYVVCSKSILGKFAKQLDITLDDGVTNTGSLRVVSTSHKRGDPALATTAVLDDDSYTVCMSM